MNTIEEYCKKITESPLAVCVWGAIILILLILIYMSVHKQGFLNEFRSAPIASQRSSDLLGIGQPMTFSSEFSSTSQGGSHVVGESMAAAMARGAEHMTGNYEAPVFHEIPTYLESEQQSSAGSKGMGEFKTYYDDHPEKKNESFVGRNMFSEAFNVDEKLKSILHNK
jgi:hypothetical protein